MVNIAQSYLILHFSINCMLLLVILGFTRLNSIGVSVSSESLSNPWFNSVQLGLFLG